MQSFLSLVDKHCSSNKRKQQSPIVFHVWYDTSCSSAIIAGNNNHHHHRDDDEGISEEFSSPLISPTNNNKQRPRGNSMPEHDREDQQCRGRGRSQSISNDTASLLSRRKKKIHPRSKEAQTTATSVMMTTTTTTTTTMGLDYDGTTGSSVGWQCRPHFFTGKCDESLGKGKKGGCAHLHCHQTLRKVVTEDAVIKTCEAAALEAVPEDILLTHPRVMEATQYMSVSSKYDAVMDASDSNSSKSFGSETISKLLADHQVKLSNVMFVAMNDCLVYDRNQNGTVLSDEDFAVIASGSSLSSKYHVRPTAVDGDSLEIMTNLPGSILEHVLTFLPDSAVAVITQVCSAWYHEIGRHSINLWKHLLERRSWPLPDETDVTSYREAFLSHYTVMRNINAIQLGTHALLTRKLLQHEREMCFHSYSTGKFAPNAQDHCAGVCLWSPARTLVAYAHDCSLRLFEAAHKDDHGSLSCRELVYQSVDPYRHTKSKSCQIMCMGLDDEYIGCICTVTCTGDAQSLENTDILVTASREDFLQGHSSTVMEAAGTTNSHNIDLSVINIADAVLNYLSTLELADHRLLQLLDFIDDGGDVGDVKVVASRKSIAACGYGRFMIEVAISLPADQSAAEEPEYILLDRKLAMYSAAVGAIVWMGDSSDIAGDLRSRFGEVSVSIAFLRHREPGDTRPVCYLAAGCLSCSEIFVGLIDSRGSAQPLQVLPSSISNRSEPMVDGWHQDSFSLNRKLTITPTYIVAGDTMKQLADGELCNVKSVLSFYPIHERLDQAASPRTLRLNGSLRIIQLVNLTKQHVLAVCQQLKMQNTNGAFDVIVVCVHVPSACEIYRSCLLEGVEPTDMDVIFPSFSQATDETISMTIHRFGLIMTGTSIRSLADQTIPTDELMSQQSLKKKKKKTTFKQSKKDGFARGMSLRG